MRILTQQEINELRSRYTTLEPGVCRVCGGELTVSRMGQLIQYNCSEVFRKGFLTWNQGGKEQSDHYSRSEVSVVPGDSRVLSIIEMYERELANGRYWAEKHLEVEEALTIMTSRAEKAERMLAND